MTAPTIGRSLDPFAGARKVIRLSMRLVRRPVVFQKQFNHDTSENIGMLAHAIDFLVG